MEDGHSGNALCLQCKFRANVVYSEDRVQDAEASADRLRGFFRRVMVYDTCNGAARYMELSLKINNDNKEY